MRIHQHQVAYLAETGGALHKLCTYWAELSQYIGNQMSEEEALETKMESKEESRRKADYCCRPNHE